MHYECAERSYFLKSATHLLWVKWFGCFNVFVWEVEGASVNMDGWVWYSSWYILDKKGQPWAATWQNQQNECVPREDSDQHGPPPSLIRFFAFRIKKAGVLSYPLSAQGRHWSDWVDAQADLNLRWAHTHFVGFVMSWLIHRNWCRLRSILEHFARKTLVITPAVTNLSTYLIKWTIFISRFVCFREK